ncbi:signal recognition particle receptor FtsY [Thermaurantimonas aggregans]|uniref:Signal recognition particle receptor FtsY n=1 Tax=Thermaurantimonas aggregans TaxID=2173829 RepID=A0A401XJV9_9FLAO|nr:signal recognition particle-docking protein FtsY [Thermaurantimonas aggregans]MCX8148924.1 signal recognition particle-docking protein FtsY [Thermaurantimonas aggregans]GCD77261.1 signal recognition particle receptor FtsY [Thermaurantimonas aggregans]
MNFFKKIFGKEEKQTLDRGLEKTRNSFLHNLGKAIAGRSTIDDEVLDELEEILLTADVGVQTTLKIIERIQNRVAKDKYLGANELNRILQEEIAGLLAEKEDAQQSEIPEGIKPYVILVVGVNGVGKTTTIGKLASRYKKMGKEVVLGAGDTFRAAAVDQLVTWGERAGVPVIKQQMGSDPASVAYDTVQSAISRGADVAIIDTAGRLHNKTHLMNELAKIRRVIQKLIPEAPHEVMLVIDASTGQNAFEQAKQFSQATQVTSLIVTKLDGTAKGGVVIGVSDQLNIPVRYIGVGEGIDHLQPFDKMAFVESFFGK